MPTTTDNRPTRPTVRTPAPEASARTPTARKARKGSGPPEDRERPRGATGNRFGPDPHRRLAGLYGALAGHPDDDQRNRGKTHG